MEPATLYLACLGATFGVWLVGDRMWSFASWVSTQSWFDGSMRRLGTVSVALLMVATAWRIAPVAADVVPMTERAIAVGDHQETQRALTRYAMATDVSASSVSQSDSGRTHTVVKGDCLWRIARSVLLSEGTNPTGAVVGRLWRQIYAENRAVIGANPNLIFPGQVLVIPER